MTISKDLFLSILSLDSYNRGYQSGIFDSTSGDDPDGLGLQGNVGHASIFENSTEKFEG